MQSSTCASTASTRQRETKRTRDSSLSSSSSLFGHEYRVNGRMQSKRVPRSLCVRVSLREEGTGEEAVDRMGGRVKDERDARVFLWQLLCLFLSLASPLSSSIGLTHTRTRTTAPVRDAQTACAAGRVQLPPLPLLLRCSVACCLSAWLSSVDERISVGGRRAGVSLADTVTTLEQQQESVLRCAARCQGRAH